MLQPSYNSHGCFGLLKKCFKWHFHTHNFFLLPKSFFQKIFRHSIVGNTLTFLSLFICLGRLLFIKCTLFILILESLSMSWFFYLLFIKIEKQNYTFLCILYVPGVVITLVSHLFLDCYSYLPSFCTVIWDACWGDMWNVCNQMHSVNKYILFIVRNWCVFFTKY